MSPWCVGKSEEASPWGAIGCAGDKKESKDPSLQSGRVNVLRITLCIARDVAAEHNHPGYLWSQTFQDVLYGQPVGFVSHVL